MEEDGDGEDLTPFWVQSSANIRRTDRLRRGAASIFLSSGLVVLLLLVTAVIFLVFVVPSTISFSAQIFRPNSVKKSWDSLNIVLVLVAVVFGFLSRNKNEDNKYSHYHESQASTSKQNETPKSNPSTPNKSWYNYSINEEQKSNPATANQWFGYSDYQTKLEHNSVLRRNSISYPDLREVSSSDWSYGEYPRRYYDDIHVDPGRVSDPGHLHRRHRSLEGVDHLRAPPPQTKPIVVDTLLSKSKESTSFPPPPPPTPPPPAAAPPPEVEADPENAANGSAPAPAPPPPQRRRKVNRDLAAAKPPPPHFPENPEHRNESVARRKDRSGRKLNRDVELMNPGASSPPQPPPAPPPPPHRSSKSERKRGGATGSATKDFLNSLYQKKKKKQRQKSVDNMNSLLHEPEPPLSFQIPPPSPPPPPPPPPPSVFQNLFSSKKQKRKRTITVRIEPHATSPPQIHNAREEAREGAREPQLTSQKPPKPLKMNTSDKLQEISTSGGNSPLNRIPPPPPPPPAAFFKSSAWKFVVQGDYVRINSSNSSRSGSPDLDETDSDVTPSAGDAGDATPFHPSPLFCASPDVNTKAESFISNFRAKLKMEKNYSMRREVGLSTLGPGPGPSQI